MTETTETTGRNRGKPVRKAVDTRNFPPLRVARVIVEGTVTRPLRFQSNGNGSMTDAWDAGIREAMLKRGCLRDRAHLGQCLNCALLPQCDVWPLIAPADPTRRQTGAFVRPFIPLPPDLPTGTVPTGTRATHGITVVQDGTFGTLWGQFAVAYVRATRQLAEWGFGTPGAASDGPPRRGALSVAKVQWQNPITGETQPFTADDAIASAPPLWYEEPATPAAANSDDGDDGDDDMPIPDTRLHERLVVEFVTPLRIVAAGETQRRPDLALLVRRIGERAETLCAGLKVSLPPSLQPAAHEAAVTIAAGVRIARDETRWEGGHKDGGLVGSITLDIAPHDRAVLLPALRWAQALGVGKGAQTGAGRIAVRMAE